MRAQFCLTLTLACLSGCGPETPGEARARMERETAAFRDASAMLKNRYQQYTAAGNGDSIASLFAEDGRQLPPDAPAITGRDAIAASERDAAAVYDSRLAFASERSTANGPLAVETGTYHVVATPKAGAPPGTPSIDESGKYLGYWRLEGDRWLIVELMWNPSQPLSITETPGRTPPR